ncbi:MAG: hypothetical protein IPL78_25415 [Chloroflexi bacterium]|nr:hypothetical protein [Chloroflexota bacterium]
MFRNNYDLKLVQGAQVFPIDLDCTGGSCTASDFAADLTVDLSGTWLASVAVQLLLDGGSPDLDSRQPAWRRTALQCIQNHLRPETGARR